MNFSKTEDIIKNAKKILIISHVNPDGDALGSTCAMYQAIYKRFKKKCDICTLNYVSPSYKFLPNLELAKQFYDTSLVYDLVITVDVAAIDRIADMKVLFDKAKVRINIDHHKTNNGFGDYNYINPEASSAGEVLYNLFKNSDWEIDKEMNFALTHGVLSSTSWALLSNSKINEPKFKSVPFQEILKTIEDEEYCYIDLKFCPNAIEGQWGAQPNPNFEPLPMGRRPELMLKPLPPSKIRWIFCYDVETGMPIREFQLYGNRIFFKKSYREVNVDYTFTYEDKIKELDVGNRLFNGFLRLDAKMSVKDENSGEVTTAILELPKIKLSSNLSMRLGKNYENSTVSDFYFTGYPEDSKKGTVAKITFLDRELTGDYI